MRTTDKLIEAFGELLFVVANCDGEVQEEELKVIKEKLSRHPWGKEIQWSFNYEMKMNRPIDELYKKVLFYCEMHGPDEEYEFLIDLLGEVAFANKGISEEESKLIRGFKSDLKEIFSRLT